VGSLAAAMALLQASTAVSKAMDNSRRQATHSRVNTLLSKVNIHPKDKANTVRRHLKASTRLKVRVTAPLQVLQVNMVSVHLKALLKVVPADTLDSSSTVNHLRVAGTRSEAIDLAQAARLRGQIS
jgi:hypothetical protein